MHRISRWLRALILILSGVMLLGCAGQAPTAPAATALQITDLEGHSLNPLAAASERATVLLFITNDCPISNAYAPEIHRLCDSYMKQGIGFYLVYVDPDLSAADAKKHYHDFGYRCPAVLDPQHELAHKAGATMTPEAVVFLPNGERVYRGRINDLYVDYGKARFAPTTNDLRDVLELIAQGRPVVARTTTAVVCHIPM